MCFYVLCTFMCTVNVTPFIAIFYLSWWSGIKPAISPGYACINSPLWVILFNCYKECTIFPTLWFWLTAFSVEILEWASQVALAVNTHLPMQQAGRGTGSIPGLGRSPQGGNGNPRQYSCLGNPTDRGAWQAVVHKVAKSQTRLKRLSMQLIAEW